MGDERRETGVEGREAGDEGREMGDGSRGTGDGRRETGQKDEGRVELTFHAPFAAEITRLPDYPITRFTVGVQLPERISLCGNANAMYSPV